MLSSHHVELPCQTVIWNGIFEDLEGSLGCAVALWRRRFLGTSPSIHVAFCARRLFRAEISGNTCVYISDDFQPFVTHFLADDEVLPK